MADVEIRIDQRKLKKLALESDGAYQMVMQKRDQVDAMANSLGAGYRTGYYHRDHKSPAVGGTQPKYGGSTRRFRTSDGVNAPVGIVHPLNYAAMKDNMLHNTLLKAL